MYYVCSKNGVFFANLSQHEAVLMQAVLKYLVNDGVFKKVFKEQTGYVYTLDDLQYTWANMVNNISDKQAEFEEASRVHVEQIEKMIGRKLVSEDVLTEYTAARQKAKIEAVEAAIDKLFRRPDGSSSQPPDHKAKQEADKATKAGAGKGEVKKEEPAVRVTFRDGPGDSTIDF